MPKRMPKGGDKTARNCKVPETVIKMDAFCPVWGRGNKIKTWRVWCQWRALDWTAEIMDGSSLGPSEKRDAKRMMTSPSKKLVFPWPKNKARRKILKREGYSDYGSTDKRQWLVKPQDEINFEDGQEMLPDEPDEVHLIGSNTMSKNIGRWDSLDSDSGSETYQADSENDSDADDSA
ncbi:unnamed protein product [Oikopleura dioica]|uniref:Uncharacterized protein n=2 Tax=Oikopleura dioica TaxID=34765 RepID=E4XSC7_OIKDI|nr:unnamed protein product [Oikopleura dioica]